MFTAITVISVVGLLAIDQLTKWWASTYLALNDSLVLIPDVFELRYCENTGIAFSLLENQRWVFIPISLLVSVLMIVILYRSPLRRYRTFRLTCILIITGGLGNLIDRVVRGFVVDFFYFKLINFPIFNFADCCVVIGAVLLFIVILFIAKAEAELPLRTMLFGIPMKKENTHGGE